MKNLLKGLHVCPQEFICPTCDVIDEMSESQASKIYHKLVRKTVTTIHETLFVDQLPKSYKSRPVRAYASFKDYEESEGLI